MVVPIHWAREKSTAAVTAHCQVADTGGENKHAHTPERTFVRRLTCPTALNLPREVTDMILSGVGLLQLLHKEQELTSQSSRQQRGPTQGRREWHSRNSCQESETVDKNNSLSSTLAL